MEKYASLLVLFFYSHHDTFDDVLMYNFPNQKEHLSGMI